MREAVELLGDRWKVDLLETNARHHATELCRSALAAEPDLIASFGGDGTMNEVVNGLIGSSIPLTCIPVGATNVFCKMVGIPCDPREAMLSLAQGPQRRRRQRIDVGLLNGRRFVLSAGVGVDAEVVRRVESRRGLPTRLRSLYYVLSAAQAGLGRHGGRSASLEIAANGRTLRGSSVFLQNGPHYTFFGRRAIDVADGSRFDDGGLSGGVLRRAKRRDVPGLLWRAFTRRPTIAEHAQVESFRAEPRLRISSADWQPVAAHVDGEFVGRLANAAIGIEPRALVIAT